MWSPKHRMFCNYICSYVAPIYILVFCRSLRIFNSGAKGLLSEQRHIKIVTCIFYFTIIFQLQGLQCWVEEWQWMINWEESGGKCGLIIGYSMHFAEEMKKTTISMLDTLATGLTMKHMTWIKSNCTICSTVTISDTHRISWCVQRHNVWLCFTILSHYTRTCKLKYLPLSSSWWEKYADRKQCMKNMYCPYDWFLDH